MLLTQAIDTGHVARMHDPSCFFCFTGKQPPYVGLMWSFWDDESQSNRGQPSCAQCAQTRLERNRLGELRTVLSANRRSMTVKGRSTDEAASVIVEALGRNPRYWIATEDRTVTGIVLQSPLDFAATFTPMNSKAVHAIVDAIVADGIALPGAIGEALTALAFAACWMERIRCGAVPVRGLRLYELHDLRDRVAVRGSLRRPMPGEQDLLVGWMTAFYAEVDERGNPQRNVDDGMASDGLWLWDEGGPVSMAALFAAAAGVRRVQGVYTPEQYRNRGYAGACVSGLAIKTHRNGQRCMLFADLGNAASELVISGIGFHCGLGQPALPFRLPEQDRHLRPRDDFM